MARSKLYQPARGKVVLKPKNNSNMIENDAYTVPHRVVLGGVDALNMQNYKKVRVSNAFLYGIQSLSLLEKRVVNMLIAQIQRHDRFCFTMSEGVIRTRREIEKRLNNMPYYIHAKDFAEIYGYANVTNAYRDLKKGVESLQSKTIELLTSPLSADVIETQTAQLFSKIQYLPHKGGLRAYFHSDVYDHVIWLPHSYTSFSLRLSGTMRTIYSLRIYEFLQSRKDTNRILISRERFCALLGLPDTYRKLHSRCYSKVIKPAMADLQRLGVTCGFGYYRRKGGDVYSFEVDKNDNEIMDEHGLTNEDRTVLAFQSIRRASEVAPDNQDTLFPARPAQALLTQEQWDVLLTDICNGVPKEIILTWPPKVFNEVLPFLFERMEQKEQAERLKREKEEAEQLMKRQEEIKERSEIDNTLSAGQQYVISTFETEYEKNDFITAGKLLQKYFAENTDQALYDGIQDRVSDPYDRYQYLFYLQEVGDRVSVSDAIYYQHVRKSNSYTPWLDNMLLRVRTVHGYKRIRNYCLMHAEKYQNFIKEQDEKRKQPTVYFSGIM